MFLEVINSKIFDEISTIQHYDTAPLAILLKILSFITLRNMFLLPFDSSQLENSNELYFEFLQSLNPKLFNETLSSAIS